MSKIGFVTDSTAYLHPDFVAEHQIEVVSLVINFEGESFLESELNGDYSGFYNRLRQVSSLPTTSQPSLGAFLEAYQKLGEKVDYIFSIHITEGISGTVKTATAAARMLPHLDITVIDSNGTASSEYLIIDAAIRAANKGLGKKEIIEIAKFIAEHNTLLFLPNTLEYLRRGGRIGGAAAIAGNFLQIKPILYFNRKKNCIIDVYEKVRTQEKGLQKMIIEMNYAYSKADNLLAAVIEVDAVHLANKFTEHIYNFYPGFVLQEICSVGPVIGAHIGPGTLGLCYCPLSQEMKELY